MVVYRQKKKWSEILEVRQRGKKRRMAAESSWLNEAGVPAAEEHLVTCVTLRTSASLKKPEMTLIA